MTFTGHTPESDRLTNERVLLSASPGTKLFPTVVITSAQEHLITFDFAPAEGCKPLSSVLLTNPEDEDVWELDCAPEMPLCPPRMKIMALSPSQWLRQPPHKDNYMSTTTPAGALKVVAEREPCYCIYVTLPEEDKVIDILELSESHKLKDFHIQTLQAYCAVCSHSNLTLSESIAQFLDTEQILQCLKIDGVRYELRSAYLKLFSALHLDHEVQTRLTTSGEFILPLSACSERIPLFASKESCSKMLPPDEVASTITHNLTSVFSQGECNAHAEQLCIQQLKGLVFG